ncbi:MAG: cytochrome c-type biogenesis protein CcmH [Sandarakinorhabdus sp.]|nr:cytochrome c-type biogenesis protein CcmH [Sandarakinorhabdus sp.]
MRRWWLLLLLAQPVLAVQPDEMLADAKLEVRARDISEGLRCVVCQNQSIDDSDAPLAKDLRIVVREQLMLGKSDTDVTAYVVSRYGNFVLLKPPVEPATWALWAGPFAVLIIGGGAMAVWSRRRRLAETAPLSAAEADEVARL